VGSSKTRYLNQVINTISCKNENVLNY